MATVATTEPVRGSEGGGEGGKDARKTRYMCNAKYSTVDRASQAHVLVSPEGSILILDIVLGYVKSRAGEGNVSISTSTLSFPPGA